MFIDTHAHIYSDEFKVDLQEMLDRAFKSGLTDILMPNIDMNSFDGMMDIAAEYKNCHPMIGLHPCHVKDNYLDEMNFVEIKLAENKFVAIGEIGIDLYWDKSFANEQEIVFKRQISLANDANLPIVIHSRDSLDLTIEIVESAQNGNLKGVFHCFNGNVEQAKKIMNIGFLMGIGGVVTYKNSGLDKVVEQIPLEHIILETDSPYLSPVPYRGKRNECAYLNEIASKIAQLKFISLMEVGEITSRNAKSLFKI